MKAYRIVTQTKIEPFGNFVSDAYILNKPLLRLQNEILAEAGVIIESEPPLNEPFLLISDRVYFSVTLIERLKEEAEKGHRGRLLCMDPVWNETMRTIVSDDLHYEIAIVEGSLVQFDDIPDLTIDWNFRKSDPLPIHSSMKHAARDMMVGPCLAFTILHWVDLLRVNQLAILEKAERTRYLWKKGSIVDKLMLLLQFLFKIHSLNPQKIARRIGTQGKNCKIHPTAVIEACEIGDNVEIGPYSVLRASVIGDGVKIEEHVTMNLSVVGKEARVNRYTMLNLSVLLKNAMVSQGGGFQMCLFGQDAFVAVGTTMLDLSFGKTIAVEHQGERIDTKQHFLGVCIGNEAVIGNAVRLTYGATVPNQAFLVGGIEKLIIDPSDVIPKEPMKAENGKVTSARKTQK